MFSNDHDAILISVQSNPILSCVSNITSFDFGQVLDVCENPGDCYSQLAVLPGNTNYHNQCCRDKNETNRANYIHVEYAFLNFVNFLLNDGNIVINKVNFVLEFYDSNHFLTYGWPQVVQKVPGEVLAECSGNGHTTEMNIDMSGERGKNGKLHIYVLENVAISLIKML